MALQLQNKPVALYGGIETKVDPKYVTPDKLLSAENVQFFGVNRARKRYGQTSLSKSIANASALISTGKAIGNFNNELLMYDGTTVYAYGQSQAQWVSRGALTEVSLSRTAIVRSSGSVSGVASISALSAEYYAWEDSRGGVYYCVRDAQSGTMLVPNTLLSVSASGPQFVASGTAVYLFYIDAGALYAGSFDTTNPAAGLTGSQLLIPAIGVGGRFTVASTTTRVLLAYAIDAANWGIQIFDAAMALLTTNTIAVAAALGSAAALAYSTDGSRAVLTIADTGASRVRISSVNVTTGAGALSTPIVATSLAHIGIVGTAATTFSLYFDRGYGTTMPSVRYYTIDASYSSALVNTTYGLSLASQPVFTTGSTYFVAASPLLNLAGATSQQTTFYLCNTAGTIIERFSADSAFVGGTVIPRVQVLSDGRLFVGLAERTSLRADAIGTVYTVSGLTAAYFTFPTASNFKIVSFGTTGVISCGNTYTYDGTNIVESGFWEFPDGLSLQANTFGGNLNAGIYNYCVTYEWQDAAGNTHYSAPSYPLACGTTLAPIAAGAQLTIRVPYTALTRKVGTTVNIYRTATSPGVPGGTDTGLGPWFKIHSQANLTDGTASFDYTDQASDASIQGNQFLYAPPDGQGEIDNFAPPAFSFMVATKTRVFGFAQDDSTALWYSKPLALGRPAEFTPFQVVRVESDGGLPTGLSYIDAQAVIFKAQRIYFLPGDGPNAGGQGTFFPAPQLISSTSGCVSSPSILSMHDGVIYKSQLGLQMLNRSLTVLPGFGTPIQGFNSLTLTAAVSAPDQNQLRWTSSNGTALVYDYVTSRWCTYTGYASVGYTPWNSTYARLRSDGTVFYENQATYLDDGVAVRMLVETAWLKPAEMAQGYAAVWYAQVLGMFLDAHTLTVETAYDYTDVAAQTNVWVTAGNINTSTFGSSATFGSDAFFGGNVAQPSTNYQLRVALRRQTCESVKFKIYDSSITGASCDLNEITLQLGVIGGLNRTTPGRQV